MSKRVNQNKAIKKTVFISSTYTDLIKYRKAVWELLDKYEVIVKGMEAFGARKESPLDTCISEVSQSDIYVGIIASRLGSIEPNSGLSYTRLEYERALKEKKEILIYIIDEREAAIPPIHVDKGANYESLTDFKQLLKSKHTVDTFKDENDLIEKLEKRFNHILISEEPSEVPLLDFDSAKKIINKFLLFPKSYSGSEIKLKIKISKDTAFPASEALCSTFGLKHTETIGVPIKIIEPDISTLELNELFIEEALSDFYFEIEKDLEVEIIATLLFSSKRVSDTKGRFHNQIIYTQVANPNYNPMLPSHDYFTPISLFKQSTPNTRFIDQKQVVEGDGKAILLFKQLSS